MAETENTFPTIRDLRDRLGDLVEQGLGELPVQILIVPDSTLQAIARNAGQKDDAKPALMIDLFDGLRRRRVLPPLASLPVAKPEKT